MRSSLGRCRKCSIMAVHERRWWALFVRQSSMNKEQKDGHSICYFFARNCNRNALRRMSPYIKFSVDQAKAFDPGSKGRIYATFLVNYRKNNKIRFVNLFRQLHQNVKFRIVCNGEFYVVIWQWWETGWYSCFRLSDLLCKFFFGCNNWMQLAFRIIWRMLQLRRLNP